MNWKSKYIIVDIGGGHELPIVFSELMGHADVAQPYIQRNKDSIVGAGFCYVDDDRYTCYGESIGLHVKSRNTEDEAILNKFLVCDV